MLVLDWWERWQIPLYLAALVLGALIGLAAPATAPAFEVAINPVLMALLYATFLSVPLTKVGQALRDGRFLAGLTVLNFLIVPVVVYLLSRFVADDQALLLGVLLVLLAPCIDYVIAFSGLADPARLRLLSQLSAEGCGPVSVGELTETSGLSQPTVSHHLKRLTETGLLDKVRVGRTMTHQVRPELFAELRTVLQMD
ncbi:metalloregulator ArsR/SmtB family transcription factor [Corynebacterium glucuronolyticum]|uniref:Metalloregulator ArsR/SmtB family transcription factor n=3 Tax=Corynebacterium glucuronolyticum TaxID=39791 RepID=A0AAX1L9U7_9CORY|nr:transcriptional regulator, ArsR family [Corynebacterium glucuronolyticum ATCC 51866]QRP70782.1 metalloregulator ArsR/SmtB family transcription factor [Corynebacterium glucuronolyticum]